MWKLLVTLLIVLAAACSYISPSAPTRIAWYQQGFGSRVIDVPLTVAEVQINLYSGSGECGPYSVADISTGIASGRICPGDKVDVTVKLNNGNTLKIVAPQETTWIISETVGR